jgi:hypothetical protein
MEDSMESARLDGLALILGRRGTRRGTLGALLGLLSISNDSLAAKKRKKRKRCRRATVRCGRRCCRTAGLRPDCCPTTTGKRCTNKKTDPANCGACGNACDAGEVCVAGLCWRTCPEASGCFGAKLCDGGNLCVAVDGVAVCTVSATCDQLVDCTTDPAACPVGTACGAICCGNAAQTCRTPV